MGLKIFLTGATGFIGGDFFYLASHTHPEWEWTCLVRDSNKGAQVAASYPKVRLVYGDLDSSELLTKEASNANVVVHTASDEHVGAAQAIMQGLSQRQSTDPAFYIHTSGAFSLALQTMDTGNYGARFDKVYDDLDGIQELIDLPERAPHRRVDNIILADHTPKFRTAIVAPSVIYGVGRGPVNTKSVPFLGIFAKLQKVIMIGSGDNIWHYIHVQDLSKLYLALVEAAAADGGQASWDSTGYYLAENGSYINRDMLQLVAQIGHKKGLFTSPNVQSMTEKEVNDINTWLKIMIGVDSQGRARRAREVLGWEPVMPRFEDELDAALDAEVRAGKS